MKKILVALMALAMVLTMAACGGNGASSTANASSTAAVSSAAASSTAAE